MPIEYRVRRGDCISSIAYEHGLLHDTLWNEGANAELRESRPDPNVLQTGDTVVVPDLRKGEAECATGGKHTFRRKGLPEQLRVILKDESGEPIGDAEYMLDIDGRLVTGFTDADGLLEETIPPNARHGRLTIGEGDEACVYEMVLGALDPVSDLFGAQQRLRNLGFASVPIDGEMGAVTRNAIAMFQGQHGLEQTGELDQTTMEKLAEAHGC